MKVSVGSQGFNENWTNQKADLHTHTTYSDGFLAPSELIQRARTLGLEILGITDHDTVNGIEDSIEIGKALGVEIVPGVELSSAIDDREIHIVGYFVDYRNKDLLEHLTFSRVERLKRAERIVEKLNSINVPLKLDVVLEKAGPGAVGRPHIANALLDEGLTASYVEAFSKYIGYGGPAYETKYSLSPEGTIALIACSRGLSFLAHPGKYTTDIVLHRLIKSGLDGIEVVHPSHTPEKIQHYHNIVSQYFLLESGGSDFHGGKRDDDEAFGSYNVPTAWVQEMKKRLFRA
jgi:predicted metal-dependent phosphoesterase TrpH